MTIKLLDNLDVARRFPTQVLEILDRLRKSKSKERDCDPKELKFSLEWSERIGGTVKSNRIDRIYVCLNAKINRWQGYAATVQRNLRKSLFD